VANNALYSIATGYLSGSPWKTASVDLAGAPELDEGEEPLLSWVGDNVYGATRHNRQTVGQWNLDTTRFSDDDRVDGAVLVTVTTHRVIWRRRLAPTTWVFGHLRYEWLHEVLAILPKDEGKAPYAAFTAKTYVHGDSHGHDEFIYLPGNWDISQLRALRNWIWWLTWYRTHAWALQWGAHLRLTNLDTLADEFDPADTALSKMGSTWIGWTPDGAGETGTLTSTNWEPERAGVTPPPVRIPAEVRAVPAPLQGFAVPVVPVVDGPDRPMPTPFWLLALRSSDDEATPVLPSVAGPGPDLVRTAADGTTSVRFGLRDVHVRRSIGDAERFADNGTLHLTDNRVIVWVPKWTRGNRWFGSGTLGVTFAVAARTVSAARAAYRRHGTVLAGHIPYACVERVVVPARTANKTLIVMTHETVSEPYLPRLLCLQIRFGGRNEALAVASNLVALVARDRLVHPPSGLAEADQARLAELAAGIEVPSDRDAIREYLFPGAAPMSR
jgi:hypothetical protein